MEALVKTPFRSPGFAQNGFAWAMMKINAIAVIWIWMSCEWKTPISCFGPLPPERNLGQEDSPNLSIQRADVSSKFSNLLCYVF
jgi:hypothetical protein